MALEVQKQEKETTQNLIRRFTQAVRESGILMRARKNRFKEKKKSETAKKRTAKLREEMKKKQEMLAKLGKITEK